MRARELAEFLLRYPDHLVQLECPDAIAPALSFEIDIFDEEEGWSVLISTEDGVHSDEEKATKERR